MKTRAPVQAAHPTPPFASRSCADRLRRMLVVRRSAPSWLPTGTVVFSGILA